jgi:hypothetical protein
MKKILPIILALAVVGGVSFFAGTKCGQNKTADGFLGSNFPQGGAFGNGTSTRARVNAGGGIVSGEIISSDSASITVKLLDGGSKIIFFSDATEISKSVSGAISDLKAGETITVSGTSNQDGSVTAKSIQVRPNNLFPMM